MPLCRLNVFSSLLAVLATMVIAIDNDGFTAPAVVMNGDGDNTTGTGLLGLINGHITSMQPTYVPFTSAKSDDTSIKKTYTNITSSLTSAIPTTSQPDNAMTTRPPDPTDYNLTPATVTHNALTKMTDSYTTWMTTTSISPPNDDITSVKSTDLDNNVMTTSQTDYYTTIQNNSVTDAKATLATSMAPTGLSDKTTMMITAGQGTEETISMSNTSPSNDVTLSLTTVNLTNDNTTSMAMNSPAITDTSMTSSLTNSGTTSMTTISLTNIGTSIQTTISVTTNSPTILDTSMATGLTNSETTSMTTISLTNNSPTITDTSLTTNSPTITDTSLTTNSPTITDTSLTTNSPTTNNTISATITGPRDNTTLMTSISPTNTDTTGLTTTSTNISATPIINGTSSMATAILTDNTRQTTTWNTTATQSVNDTTTPIPTSPAETSASITTTRLTLSTATSGATTYETTSDLIQTSANNATKTPPIITERPTIVCPTERCPFESICLNGTCQCLSGSHLVGDRCIRAQVFAGHLHLTSLTFKKEMLNRSSKEFQDTAANISAALAAAFAGQHGYLRSEVVLLAPGSVIATVSNIFENTEASQEDINQVIKGAIGSSSENDLLADATFSGTELCDLFPHPCDVSTAECNSINGLVSCSCKGGFISTVYSNTSCKACPSGQEVVGNTCQNCPFGYAGFNCKDSSLLAVVVVSCVLGGILLIFILALLSYCCWLRCSGSQADQSDASPYPAGELTKAWPVGITPIPRATTSATWDATSTMEMMDKRHHGNGVSGSYDLNPHGMKTFQSKTPSRYSYLVQGHENPYFLPGDNKKM
ncbi:uncharacterized protein LOC144088635 isoform X2 [Stigmatopora argus]